MWKQIVPIFTLWWKPKQTLLSLPAEKLYMVAYLIVGLSGLIRTYERGSTSTRMTDLILIDGVLIFLIGLAMFIVAAAFVTWIVFLFGKRLRIVRVMNILGYANTPVLAGYALAAAYGGMGLEQPGSGTGIQIAVSLLTAYSVVLWVWGLIIVPGRPKPATEA